MIKAAALLALSLAPALAVGFAEDATAAPVQGDKKGYHINKKFGFQIKPPKEWTNVPLKTDESWLGAKYRSDRSYFFHDKLTGQTHELVPELQMICLVKANMGDGVKVEEDDDETTVSWSRYKDYDDFLAQNFSGGGYFLDSTKETKVGGVPVTQHLYKIEKLTVPKYIVTWIYHTDDIDYVIQTVVFQDKFKKVKKILDRTYKSFKLVERSGEDLSAKGGGITFVTRKEMDAEDPKERRTKRMESEEELRKRAIDGLPDDWDSAEYGNILVLSHVDKKLAKRMGQHADALIKWMEQTFPYFGEGEYARKPILRICKDYDEMLSFYVGAGIGQYTTGEIPRLELPTNKPAGGFTTGSTIDNLNGRLMSLWFYDKDPDLANAMPFWLRGGLSYIIGGLRKDGRILKFRENDNDRTQAKEFHNKGVGATPREFMRFTYEDFGDAGGEMDRETGYRNQVMSYAFVRFLLSKDCKKNKYTKDLLETYITTLSVVSEEMSERLDAMNDTDAPETEEEEAAAGKARRERFTQMERETVDAAFDRAFGEWGDEEWDSVHEAFFKWL